MKLFGSALSGISFCVDESRWMFW